MKSERFFIHIFFYFKRCKNINTVSDQFGMITVFETVIIAWITMCIMAHIGIYALAHVTTAWSMEHWGICINPCHYYLDRYKMLE